MHNFTISKQLCFLVADAVLVLELHSNATLYWQLHPKETCDVTQFQVDIVGDRDDEFSFKVSRTYIELTFLEVCEQWRITVTPISNGVLGYGRTLTQSIPLPAGEHTEHTLILL